LERITIEEGRLAERAVMRGWKTVKKMGSGGGGGGEEVKGERNGDT